MQAFYELNLPKSELWFIGGGLEDSPLKSVIKKYQRPNIMFKGSYPQKQLQSLYAQGSVFVLASLSDGFGMVVPQAMACGLPVIVTTNVGAADIVTDEKNGLIVEACSVDALKDAILKLYESEETRMAYATNAQKEARKSMSWDNYGERLVNFLATKTEK